MSDVIQIHMQSFEVCCAVCAQPCSKGYGVPMYEGLLVSTSWTGPWAGMPACFECYGKHGRGELETFDDSIDPPAVEVERAADVEAFVRTLADDLSAAAPEGVRWAIVVQTGPEEPVRVAVHNAGSAGGVEELVRRLGIAMAAPASDPAAASEEERLVDAIIALHGGPPASKKIFVCGIQTAPEHIEGYAVREDGLCLAVHVSSSFSFCKHDMGVTSNWKHEIYAARCPAGFEVVWVDDPHAHEVLRKAMRPRRPTGDGLEERAKEIVRIVTTDIGGDMLLRSSVVKVMRLLASHDQAAPPPAAAGGASVVSPAAPFARVGDGVHWFDAIGSAWVQVPDEWMDYHAFGDVRVTLRPVSNPSSAYSAVAPTQDNVRPSSEEGS